jgi:regulator of replication initiation timing
MELRNTEAEIDSLTEFYITLQLRTSRSRYSNEFMLTPITNTNSTESSRTVDSNSDKNVVIDAIHSNEKVLNDKEISAIDIRNDLIVFQQRVESLQTVMNKFRQRLEQVDPITQQPRYGAQTKQRVQNIIQSYDQLVQVYNAIFSPQINLTVMENPPNKEDSNLIATINSVAAQEVTEEQNRLELERQQAIVAEELRQQTMIEHQRQLESERIMAIQREQEEFRRQTEQIIEARRAVQLEQERQTTADRIWMESIPNRNTLIGVQEQLHIFVTNCQNEQPSTIKSSLQALHTMFSQIVSHPDNENYRRIRRNHPQFIQDIGQYQGGVELLICAGFQLGMIDNSIPSYICKEPNVETDLDGWSDWFDLLKGTLDLIEKEMIK